ncbi:MAG: Rrf2 family transcriptional regulator [Candidatus Muiribacteriota bacterium]|jgi:Rrf2 family protein
MGIIKFSESVSIAVHGLAYLCLKNPEKIGAKEIASILSAYENTVAKVFQKLVKAKLVLSERGPKGGFFLNKGAGDITFLDIYQAIEGELDEVKCPFSRTKCPFGGCVLGNTIPELDKQLREYLESKKLSEFIKEQ